jgi:hypothetical protein
MKTLSLILILSLVLMPTCTSSSSTPRSSPGNVSSNGAGNLDFMPLGLYTVLADEFHAVRAGGFNMVQVYHDTQSLDEAQAYLEAAKAEGLKVLQNMPRDYIHADDSFWIRWVSTLSTSDALAMWYLPEEPTLRGVSHADIARLYNIIHQYDPKHRPAATYFGIEGPLNDWCDVVDIIMAGCYADYEGEPRACMKLWIDTARQDCPSRTVIGVPPFFDASDFGRSGGHPTPHEARFDAYTALIGGAKGLNWFSYQNGARLTELWDGLQGIVGELHELSPVILSSTGPQTATVSVISGPTQSPDVEGHVYDSIQLLQKEVPATYLFASNLATDTVVAEFSGLSPDVVAVDVLYEGRRIPVSGGSFRDSFAEADVHIYWAPTNIVYLPTIMKTTRGSLSIYRGSEASVLGSECVRRPAYGNVGR